MTTGDWLIEAARRPVVKCSHDFSAVHDFCTHCHRSAEDICNEDRVQTSFGGKTAIIHAIASGYIQMGDAVTMLPDGMVMKAGKPHVTCRSCDNWYERPVDVEDFDPDDNSMNYCGGSPRCCP